MAKMKAMFASEAEVPATMKDFYAANDEGQFVLQVEAVNGFVLENVTALKSAHAEVLEDRKRLRKWKSDLVAKIGGEELLDSLSEDLAELKKLREKLDKPNPNDKDALKAAIDRETAALTKKYDEQVSALTKERDGLLTEINHGYRRSAILAALAKHQLVDGGAELLEPHLLARTRTERSEDGKGFAVRAVDEKGNVAISMKQGQNGPMEVDELVESLKSRAPFSHAFAGSGASGSGAKGGNPGRGGKSDQSVDPMSLSGPALLAHARANAKT